MKSTQKLLTILGSVMLVFGPCSAALAQTTGDTVDFIRKALQDPNVHEIVIPEGSYIANQPIVINRDGVTLRGQGSVTITLADHANAPLLIIGNVETPPKPVHDIKVENLVLMGNRDAQDMECWGGKCDSGGVTFIRNNGITIRGAHRIEVANVETKSFRSGGIVTEKVCTHLHVNTWTSMDNYFDGFAGYETTQSLFENLTLSENMGAGISLDIHFHDNTFKNVRMKKDMDVGIFMRDSNNNHFVDFTIVDTGSHAAFVSRVDEIKGTEPKNNIFENFVIVGSKGDGFFLNHANEGNQLINFTFTNVRGKNVVRKN
jgi:hypothetical protein